MKAVKFDVSPELLAEMLHLPTGVWIYNATGHSDHSGRTVITLYVADESVPEADAPHEASPSWTEHQIQFNGWGIK